MGNVHCLHHTPSIRSFQHNGSDIIHGDHITRKGKITKLLNFIVYYINIFLGKKLSSNALDDTITDEEKWDSKCDNANNEEIKNLNNTTDETEPACRHPKFITFQSRIDSFINWPVHHPKSASELAEAGFFYTGIGDRVICYHCGGGVKDWLSGDSPWVEHAIWFGNCDFLVANKGQQFVEKVKSIQNRSRFSEISAEVHEHKVDKMNDEIINDHINDEEVEAMKKLETSRTCKICFENELSILFLPCGHLTACAECAPKMNNCPICRLQPLAFVRAYLP